MPSESIKLLKCARLLFPEQDDRDRMLRNLAEYLVNISSSKQGDHACSIRIAAHTVEGLPVESVQLSRLIKGSGVFRFHQSDGDIIIRLDTDALVQRAKQATSTGFLREELPPPVGFVDNVHPVRPGQRDCQQWVKFAECKFGTGCVFNHPELRGAAAHILRAVQRASSSSSSTQTPLRSQPQQTGPAGNPRMSSSSEDISSTTAAHIAAQRSSTDSCSSSSTSAHAVAGSWAHNSIPQRHISNTQGSVSYSAAMKGHLRATADSHRADTSVLQPALQPPKQQAVGASSNPLGFTETAWQLPAGATTPSTAAGTAAESCAAAAGQVSEPGQPTAAVAAPAVPAAAAAPSDVFSSPDAAGISAVVSTPASTAGPAATFIAAAATAVPAGQPQAAGTSAAAAAAATPPSATAPLAAVCPMFLMRGICMSGPKCPYSHPTAESRTPNRVVSRSESPDCHAAAAAPPAAALQAPLLVERPLVAAGSSAAAASVAAAAAADGASLLQDHQQQQQESLTWQQQQQQHVSEQHSRHEQQQQPAMLGGLTWQQQLLDQQQGAQQQQQVTEDPYTWQQQEHQQQQGETDQWGDEQLHHQQGHKSKQQQHQQQGSKVKLLAKHHMQEYQLFPITGSTPEGLPHRPGAPNCPFYMHIGSCKFGPACVYHHPDCPPQPINFVKNGFAAGRWPADKPVPYSRIIRHLSRIWDYESCAEAQLKTWLAHYLISVANPELRMWDKSAAKPIAADDYDENAGESGGGSSGGVGSPFGRYSCDLSRAGIFLQQMWHEQPDEEAAASPMPYTKKLRFLFSTDPYYQVATGPHNSSHYYVRLKVARLCEMLNW